MMSELIQVEDILLSDSYNTTVGVTSEEFKYYDLTGLSNGSSLKLNGVGQNVRNRMADTIITSTHHGVTISYEVLTGIVTLNGTYTNASASNYTLAENIDLGLNPGDWVTLLRYYESGTIDLNDSYIGYLLQGSGVSNRINENSESLYDPYISQVGTVTTDSGTWGQRIILQFWKQGMVFNNFKFKLAIYAGTALQGYSLPSATGIQSEVQIFNKTINKLNPSVESTGEGAEITLAYDSVSQTYTVDGTSTATGKEFLLKTDGRPYLEKDTQLIDFILAAINSESRLKFEDSFHIHIN